MGSQETNEKYINNDLSAMKKTGSVANVTGSCCTLLTDRLLQPSAHLHSDITQKFLQAS